MLLCSSLKPFSAASASHYFRCLALSLCEGQRIQEEKREREIVVHIIIISFWQPLKIVFGSNSAQMLLSLSSFSFSLSLSLSLSVSRSVSNAIKFNSPKVDSMPCGSYNAIKRCVYRASYEHCEHERNHFSLWWTCEHFQPALGRAAHKNPHLAARLVF